MSLRTFPDNGTSSAPSVTRYKISSNIGSVFDGQHSFSRTELHTLKQDGTQLNGRSSDAHFPHSVSTLLLNSQPHSEAHSSLFASAVVDKLARPLDVNWSSQSTVQQLTSGTPNCLPFQGTLEAFQQSHLLAKPSKVVQPPLPSVAPKSERSVAVPLNGLSFQSTAKAIQTPKPSHVEADLHSKAQSERTLPALSSSLLFKRSVKRESFDNGELGLVLTASAPRLTVSLLLQENPKAPPHTEATTSAFRKHQSLLENKVVPSPGQPDSVQTDFQKPREAPKSDSLSAKAESNTAASPTLWSQRTGRPLLMSSSLFLSSAENTLRTKPSVTSIERKLLVGGKLGGPLKDPDDPLAPTAVLSTQSSFNEQQEARNGKSGLSSQRVVTGRTTEAETLNSLKNSGGSEGVQQALAHPGVNKPGYKEANAPTKKSLQEFLDQKSEAKNLQKQNQDIATLVDQDLGFSRARVPVPVTGFTVNSLEGRERIELAKRHPMEPRVVSLAHEAIGVKAVESGKGERLVQDSPKAEAAQQNPPSEKAMPFKLSHSEGSLGTSKASSAQKAKAIDVSPSSFGIRRTIDRWEAQPVQPTGTLTPRTEAPSLRDQQGQHARRTPQALPSALASLDARLLSYHSVAKGPSKEQSADEHSQQRRKSSPLKIEKKSSVTSLFAVGPDEADSPENNGRQNGPRKSILKRRNSPRKSKNFSKSVKINEDLNTNHHVDKYLAKESRFGREGSYFDNLRSQQLAVADAPDNRLITVASSAFSKPLHETVSYRSQAFRF